VQLSFSEIALTYLLKLHLTLLAVFSEKPCYIILDHKFLIADQNSWHSVTCWAVSTAKHAVKAKCSSTNSAPSITSQDIQNPAQNA